MGVWNMSLWDLMLAGGPLMIPILLCSVVALAIIISKWMYFASIRTDVAALKSFVFEAIRRNDIKTAIERCRDNPSPVAKVMAAALSRFGQPRPLIKEAIEEVSLIEVPKLEKRFTALATIAHVAPLLGLLGTVTGMTGSFQTIQMKAASLNPVTPGDLAGNIAEALITTVAGLSVAIPTFVAYNYLVSRVNTIVLQMEQAATELTNLMDLILREGGGSREMYGDEPEDAPPAEQSAAEDLRL